MLTEKRFTYLNASRTKYIGSFFCNDVPLTNKEVVDLLNENEQLKKENRKLKEDLEHCANQFVNDGKNVLLSLR